MSVLISFCTRIIDLVNRCRKHPPLIKYLKIGAAHFELLPGRIYTELHQLRTSTIHHKKRYSETERCHNYALDIGVSRMSNVVVLSSSVLSVKITGVIE